MISLALFLLGSLAWLTALFGPPMFALTFWNKVSVRYSGLIAHVLFLPSVLALEWIATEAIFFAAGDNGDGPPGLGLLLILPFSILIGTVVFYYIAVAWTIMRAVWRSRKAAKPIV